MENNETAHNCLILLRYKLCRRGMMCDNGAVGRGNEWQTAIILRMLGVRISGIFLKAVY